MPNPLGWPFHLGLTAALVAFAWIAYGHVTGMPFVNDDYVFIDKARRTGFGALWLPWDLPFAWYRPFSREFHFWWLDRLFGASVVVGHLANVGLWIAMLNLYAMVAAALTGPRAARISTAALAALALWGVPVSWISGSQDLWMLLFGLAFVLLALRGRAGLAAGALLLALASKETGGLWMPIAAIVLAMRGEQWPAIGRRLGAAAAVTVGWLAIHPLVRSVLAGRPLPQEGFLRPAPATAALRTLLAPINLDVPLAPEAGWRAALIAGALGAAVLGGFALFRAWQGSAAREEVVAPRRLAAGVAAWTVIGWLPLAVPAIGWHAYYGVLGTLGLWLGLGALLARVPAAALVTIVALAIGRQAAASSPSWDWGSEWYLRRAAAFLEGIHAQIKSVHPTLPPRTRLFFARMPNSIGLLAGNGPALRVWYADTTLRAGYYSAYRARPDGDRGTDLFFRFDSTRGLLPVREGPEWSWREIDGDPEWAHDHEVLAALFLDAGEIERAQVEYVKLSDAYPDDAAYSLFCGVLFAAMGRDVDAERLYERASPHLGGRQPTHEAASQLLNDLRASWASTRE